MISQEHFANLQKTRLIKFNDVKRDTTLGIKKLYLYESLALREAYDARKKMAGQKVPLYHADYEPDFTHFQYDLEMYIFLNYEALYKRELELASKDKIKLLEFGGREHGATLLKREQHLMNAKSIRWPERVLPNGAIATGYALTPWARDYIYGISNYNNVIKFGGGGQGKTYLDVAFMAMIYDHFLRTKSGAQCSASTVSEKKLEKSIWSHMVKIYSYTHSYQYSLYAGQAVKAPEYQFRRKNEKNKYIEEGGTFQGILLPSGRKTAQVIDKLTGQHDVIARVYLLDEAQSTDGAPLSAYTNMFMHPRYKWFLMNGNYETDQDLLGLNTEPNSGWDSVDETTHMWEGTVKSPDSNLGQLSLVIHYNNDLSPGVTDQEMARKYGNFLPTEEKKKYLYPTEESRTTYEYNRMWVGFRHKRKEEIGEPIITAEMLEEYGCHLPHTAQTEFILGSLDTAPSSRDRNIFTEFGIGLDATGYPEVWFEQIHGIKKASTPLAYYRETTDAVADIVVAKGIQPGHCIMDWTNRTAILEMLANRNIRMHQLIYHQSVPSKRGENEVTKVKEEPIELPVVPTFSNGIEKDAKSFAHERILNRITLGAYITRLFIEHGRIKGFHPGILRGIECKTFEKEFCLRKFETKERIKGSFLNIDSKEEFKDKYKFSPDIMDTLFQVMYLLYVIFKVHPLKPGLGLLQKKKEKEIVADRHWYGRMRRF